MSISWKKFIHFFFFFLALDLISGLDSFVKMEAYCYLGEGTEGGKSQNYELKGGCAVKLTARTVSPGASIARTIFVVSFCEPWSGEFILWGCVPIAARKKKKKRWAADSCSSVFHGDSFMRLCDVAEPCVGYRPSLPLNQTTVCDWRREASEKNQFLQNWNPTRSSAYYRSNCV